MKSFYKHFIEDYFIEINNNQKKRDDLFGSKMSKKELLRYYYEIFFDWLTSKLTKNKVKSFLFNKDNYFMNNLSKFEDTYNILQDDRSKEQYVKYIVFKSLNSPTRRLNVNIKNYSEEILKIEKLKKNEGYYDLTSLGFDIKWRYGSLAAVVNFIDEQYSYNKKVETKKDDIVIDCGGATGDTALYFAGKGAKKVYVVEFIQSSIKKMIEEIEVNAHFKNNIKIVDKPLWNKSNIKLSYEDFGNASIIGKEGLYSKEVISITIDDLVKENNIPKVDFIKMDIEGAEITALEGASNTIKKDKPKLAICVYHKNDDLVKIPALIRNLNPNYKFYFDYYTDIGWESVIYAIDEN